MLSVTSKKDCFGVKEYRFGEGMPPCAQHRKRQARDPQGLSYGTPWRALTSNDGGRALERLALTKTFQVRAQIQNQNSHVETP